MGEQEREGEFEWREEKEKGEFEWETRKREKRA